MDRIAERYEIVQKRIEQAARRTGRDPRAITLVAVTKTWPVETILAAHEAGMRHFGENRAWELAQKRPEVTERLGPDSGIVWHAIGALQSRKTGTIAEYADVFHALDRMKIANRLSRQLGEYGRSLPVFLEVNVSGEASKSGFAAHEWENDATQQAQLRKIVQTVTNLDHLQLVGLMTMAPWGAEESVVREVFRRTRQLAEWLQETIPSLQAPLQLSMGMTDDFEIAIEEGATHIRVGRAIFGERTNR